MPVEVFNESLLASSHIQIDDADALKTDVFVLAETHVAIRVPIPYSGHRHVFSYVEVDVAQPANTHILAETWIQINDVIDGDHLDTWFEFQVSHRDDWPFEFKNVDPYLDINFIIHSPDFEEFLIDFTNVDPYLDVYFDFTVYDFEDWVLELYHDKPYLEFNFIMITGDVLDINFITYSPDFEEFSFITEFAEYEDVSFLFDDFWHYIEFNFRQKLVPTYLLFHDISFETRVTARVDFTVELITIKRLLPAVISIKGKIHD